MSLADRWSETIAELQKQQCYRQLNAANGVDLCSNDYLGYSQRLWPQPPNDPDTRDLMQSRSGTAARLLRGHHCIWDEVEQGLADWHAAPSALVMNSGYVANEGLLSTVIQRDDWVASDQLNHASIIDGLRLSGAER